MARLKNATFDSGTVTGTDAYVSSAGSPTIDTSNNKCGHGNSVRHNWTASANVTGTISGLSATELWVSFYYNVATKPASGAPRIVTWGNGSTQWNIVYNTSNGTLNFRMNATTVATAFLNPTVGTTYRIGIRVKNSSSEAAADAEYDIYTAVGEAAFGAAVASGTAVTMNSSNAALTNVVFGQNNGSSPSADMYFDSIRVDNSAMPAPDVVNTTFTAAASFNTGSSAISTNFTAASSWYKQDSQFTAAASFSKQVDKTWTASASFIPVVETNFTAAASFSLSYVPTPAHNNKYATFESGTTTGTNGVDAVSGTVSVDTTSKINGANSATSSTGTSYLRVEPSPAADELFGSFYLRFSALPASAWRFMSLRNNFLGGVDTYRIQLTTAGKLEIRDDGSTNLGTGTATLAANTNYRIGYHYKRATDNSPAVFQVYVATGHADFGAADVSVASINGYANLPINRIQIGNVSSSPVQTWFIDDVAVSTTVMPAPTGTVAQWNKTFTAAASFEAIGRKQGKWRFYTDATPDGSMTALAAENTTPTLTAAQSEGGIIRLRVSIKNTTADSLSENLKLQYSQDGSNWQDVGTSSEAQKLFLYADGAATAGGTVGTRVLSDSTSSGLYHEDGSTSETVAASGIQEIDFAIRAQHPVHGTTYKFRVVQGPHDLPLDTGAVQIQATTTSSPTQAIGSLAAESGNTASDYLKFTSKMIYDGTNYWLFYAKPANTATVYYRSWSGSGAWSSESSLSFGVTGADYSDGFFSVTYKLIGTTKTVVVSGTAQNYGVVTGVEAPNMIRGVISGTSITWDSYYPVHSSLVSTELAGQSQAAFLDSNRIVQVWTNAAGDQQYINFRGQEADTGTGFGTFTEQGIDTSDYWTGKGQVRVLATGNDGGGSDTFLWLSVNAEGALLIGEWYLPASPSTPGVWGGTYTVASSAHAVDWNALRVGNYSYILYRDNASGGGNWKLAVYNHTSGTYALATNQPGISNSIDGTGIALTADTTNNRLYVMGVFAGANGTGSRVVKYARYDYGSGGTGGTWSNVGAAISGDHGNISHIQSLENAVSGKVLLVTEEGDDGMLGTDSVARYYTLNQGSPTSKTFTATASFIGAVVISNTWTAAASFQKQVDKTFTAAASFVATLDAKTWTAASSFYAQVDKTWTASAGFATQSTATWTASASFQVLHDTQFSAAASFVAQDLSAASWTASASFYKQRDASVDMTASFIRQSDVGTQMAASFVAQVDKTYTARASFSGQIDTNFTARSSFSAQRDTTFTAAAFFSDGFSYTFTARASFATQVSTNFTALSAWRGSYNVEFIITAAFAPEQEIQFAASASFLAAGDISVEMAASFVREDVNTTFTATAAFAPAVDVNFTATASFVMQNVDTLFTAVASFAKNGDQTFSVRASFKVQDKQAASFTATASFALIDRTGPKVTFRPAVNNTVSYEIRVANRSGVTVASFSSRQIISLDYTRAVNQITELKLVLPGTFNHRLLESDGIISVYRKVGSNPLYLDTDTVWFIRTIERSLDENGIKLITVTCESANSLAHQFIVAYQNLKTLGYTTKYDQAGDMMLAIANENFGTLATNTLRRISVLIEGYADKGVLMYKQFGWRYLDEIFKEICETSYQNGTPMYWDVISVNAPLGLEFHVYTNQRGRDLRVSTNAPLIVGPSQKSVTSFIVSKDYKGEVNYVYVAGPGEEDDRPVTVSEDTARARRGPFSHKEGFVDLRDATSLQTFTDEGNRALRAGAPRIVYAGKLASVPGAIYGLDWKFGDRLTAQDDEHVGYDCRVNAVHVTLQNNGEEVVDAALRSDE